MFLPESKPRGPLSNASTYLAKLMGSRLKQHIQEPGAREIQLYNVENRHGHRYGKCIYQSEVSILVM